MAGKSFGKRSFGRPGIKCEDDINVELGKYVVRM
jgi:hypothetical protein